YCHKTEILMTATQTTPTQTTATQTTATQTTAAAAPAPVPRSKNASVLRSAEDVTCAHVDRVADAIAETIVHEVVRNDPDARAGVEVSLDAYRASITGFIAAANYADRLQAPGGPLLSFTNEDLATLVQAQLSAAGYVEQWALQLPLESTLMVDTLQPDELSNRDFSDDQSIVVGFATPVQSHGWMPIEVVAARSAQQALHRCALSNPDSLGPDGKVLIGVRQQGGTSVVEFVNVSVQHNELTSFGRLHELVVPTVLNALSLIAGLEIPERFSPSWFVVNGRGGFNEGGPKGDNGLSGKKLVVDHYGPRIPIGGGALAGKDSKKADKAGALAARKLAVSIAAASGTEVMVTLAWFPGASEPQMAQAELSDGRVLDRSQIEALIGPVNLSLSAIVQDLQLQSVCWPQLVRTGYFGCNSLWDQP
ncbi:MAG: methionine adenosyltransferase domain-containing protein, partial [Microthrixaceae bacterium]